MTTLTPIDAGTVAARLAAGAVTLIDIRETDEHAREHIAGAISIPLSHLDKARLAIEPGGELVFHCKSGMRTNANCARLASLVDRPAYVLDGGLDAWKRAGLGVVTDMKAPLELNRQVQITVGALILVGAAFTALVNPAFILVPAALGAGLLLAGVSGWCGMARLLAIAPWNRRVTP